jgi:hypothetical protein
MFCTRWWGSREMKRKEMVQNASTIFFLNFAKWFFVHTNNNNNNSKTIAKQPFSRATKTIKKQPYYNKGLNVCFSTLNCAYFAFESSDNTSFFSDSFSVIRSDLGFCKNDVIILEAWRWMDGIKNYSKMRCVINFVDDP